MNDKTDIRLLAIGALAGLVAAGYGVLRQEWSGEPLPGGAVARVNDAVISREVFERALSRAVPVPADASDQQRAELLQRLVDDELLVQRGVDLGMAQYDLTVRTAIIDSLVASITAEADAASPDDAELERFLADNAERFSYTARLSIEAWESDDEAAAQALVAAIRADDTPPETGISPMPDLPPGLVPIEVLQNYIGPMITAAAAEMPDGSSAIFARRGRWLVLHVLEKEKSFVTDLGAIRNRVLLEYRRHLAEVALGDYITGLRERADVVSVNP